jgi:hypothetical protein
MFRSMVITAVLLAVGGATVQAQGPVALELRGGAAFPTADLGEASLKTGGGLELTALLRVMPYVHAYAGWDYFSFVMDETLGGTKYDVDATGYAFGLQFRHPVGTSAGLWLRAGGLYDHIELENTAGDIVADSGHELGWEVGGGVSVPVGGRVTLTPGVRYRSLSADLEVGQVTVPVDLRYVAAEIGVTYTFGARRTVAAARR